MATFQLPITNNSSGGKCDFNSNGGQLGRTTFITTNTSIFQFSANFEGEYFYRYVIEASGGISFNLASIGTIKVGYGCFIFNISPTANISVLEGSSFTEIVNIPPQTVVFISAKASGSPDIWEVFGATFGLVANFVYVDAVFGNDTTAIVNRPDKAFATIDAASVVASGSDVLLIRPGNYALSASVFGSTFFFAPGAIVDCDNGTFFITNIYGSGEFVTTVAAATPTTFGDPISNLEAERMTGGSCSLINTQDISISINVVNGPLENLAFRFSIGDINIRLKDVSLTTFTNLIYCFDASSGQSIDINIDKVVSTTNSQINLANNSGKTITITGGYFENFSIVCIAPQNININIDTIICSTNANSINTGVNSSGYGNIYINNFIISVASLTPNIFINTDRELSMRINNIETDSRLLDVTGVGLLIFEFNNIISTYNGDLITNNLNPGITELNITGNYVELQGPFVVNTSTTFVNVKNVVRSTVIQPDPIYSNTTAGKMVIQGKYMNYGDTGLFLSNGVNGTLFCSIEEIVGGDNAVSSACIVDGICNINFGIYTKTLFLSAFETTTDSTLNIIGTQITNVASVGNAILAITGTGISNINMNINYIVCTDGNVLLSERDTGTLSLSIFSDNAEVNNGGRDVISINRPLATTTYEKFVFGGRFVSSGGDVISLEPSVNQFILSRVSFIGGANSINYTGAGTQTVQNQGQTIATSTAVGTVNIGTFSVNGLFT